MSKFIPNSFQVPNVIVDELIAEMTESELKCFLLVIRKTTGWQKEMDDISISQFMALLKLSKQSVISGCDRLVEKGLLVKTTGFRGTNVFSLNWSKILTSQKNRPVKNLDITCQNFRQDPVKNLDTQNNTLQKTPKQNNTLTGINARAKKSKPDALALLEQFGIVGQLAEDFITHRKACKAPITKTALKGFQREADKAKIPIGQAVEISIERGWRGFRADWDWLDESSKSRGSRRDNMNAPWNTAEAWKDVF